MLPVQFLLLALLLAAFAVLAASEGSRRWRALDRRLGDLSYLLYLNHYGVAIACASSGFSPSLTLYATGALAALVATRPRTRFSASIMCQLRGISLPEGIAVFM